MIQRIPEEKIEEVRSANEIVEVISDYVQLKKQGRNYLGLCPFHGEKTPSFSVSPDKQLYHCFGCGAGGNVISFVMEMDGYSFIEAVQHLGKRANIDLPQLETPSKKENKNHVIIQEGHELASKYYHYVLKETNVGEKGRKYLKNRGFTEDQINAFQIGFVGEEWDGLTNLLIKRGFDSKVMELSGLLGIRDFDGKPFDRFRNRIMFPIWDGQGNVIAFGGRTLGDSQPKYLNSPETILFNKSKTLYGIHLARPHIRKENETVLFEGYVDVIAAWQAGIKNGVATLGTALTEEQAKVIRRNSEKVIICYDSDDAGINAAFRAAEILQRIGCFIKVALLPEGQDPDDYIRNYGAEAFRVKMIQQSLTLMTFKLQYLKRGKNLQDEGDRIRYIEEVLQEIATLTKAVERDHYLRQLSEEFSLSLDALKQEQKQIYYRQKKGANPNASYVQQKSERTQQYYVQPKRLLPAFHNAERLILAYMMKDTDVCDQIEKRIGGSFNIDQYQAIAAYLYAFYNEGNSPDTARFISRLPDKELQKTATELAMLQIKEEISEQELFDYIKEIENYPKWVEIERKEKEAAIQADPIEAAKLRNEIIQLKKKLKR